jgi:toxin ParE1/3/4
MKIIFSPFSKQLLNDIFVYYKRKANLKIANRLKAEILSSIVRLSNHPDLGQFEPNLNDTDKAFRFIVVSNYKIIYKKVEEGILITDIFDCRQNPEKINITNR